MEKALMTFVREHLNDRPEDVLLRFSGKGLPFSVAEAAIQIGCRRHTARKLPSFNACESFRYPSLLSAQQATDEVVARFHASLLAGRDNVADLTAGLGIDAMSIADVCSHVTAFETDSGRADALRDNLAATRRDNVDVRSDDSIEWLREKAPRFDAVFVDPARRDGAGRRTYALSDCVPDVQANLDLLKASAPLVVVKASPMLDLSNTLSLLPGLSRMIVVSLKGECKEVLAVFDARQPEFAGVDCLLLPGEGVYSVPDLEKRNDIYCPPGIRFEGLWLYEPDAAVMKLGSAAGLTSRFEGLMKCDPDTQIYLSDKFFPRFPGRVLRVEKPLKSAKDLKGEKINVVSRHYPLSAPQICEKFGIRDGGDDFLYALTVRKRKCLLLCRRP